MAQGRTVTWCLARAMGSLPRSYLGPFHMPLLRKRKTSRKWEETWSPDPVPRPCYQSLPARGMNVAFVPSAASRGFQATTSSQEGTSGAARAGNRDDQTSRGPHPEREAVRWALAKRGRPVARPRGPGDRPSQPLCNQGRGPQPGQEQAHLGQCLLLFGAQVTDSAAHRGSASGRGACSS